LARAAAEIEDASRDQAGGRGGDAVLQLVVGRYLRADAVGVGGRVEVKLLHDVQGRTRAGRRQTTSPSDSWTSRARPLRPTPTRRRGPGRSRSARSRRAQARSAMRTASAVPTAIDVERVR